jgi:hypothetical protein
VGKCSGGESHGNVSLAKCLLESTSEFPDTGAFGV